MGRGLRGMNCKRLSVVVDSERRGIEQGIHSYLRCEVVKFLVEGAIEVLSQVRSRGKKL